MPTNFERAKQVLDRRRETAEREAEQKTEELELLSPELRALNRKLSAAGLKAVQLAITGDQAAMDRLRDENLAQRHRRRWQPLLRLFQTSREEPPDREPQRGLAGGGLHLRQLQPRVLPGCHGPGDGRGRVLADGTDRLLLRSLCRRLRPLVPEPHPLRQHRSRQDAPLAGHREQSHPIEKGFNVVYGSAHNLLSEIEKEHFGRLKTDDSPEDNVLNADLLILDDLGAEFSTSFTVSMVYNIINTRILKGLPTIISTNLWYDEISDKYGNRVYSRIIGNYTPLEFAGRDVRQLKN